MPIFYPCGTVSFSSLGYFLSIVSTPEPSHYFLLLSLGVHHIQEYFNKKRDRNQKYIKPQEEKAWHEEQRNKTWKAVESKLVVGYW